MSLKILFFLVCTHPRVCSARTVICSPEDLRHVLEHIYSGQQVAAVARPVAGRRSEFGYHLRHSISHQPPLRFRQMFPSLTEKETAFNKIKELSFMFMSRAYTSIGVKHFLLRRLILHPLY